MLVVDHTRSIETCIGMRERSFGVCHNTVYRDFYGISIINPRPGIILSRNQNPIDRKMGANWAAYRIANRKSSPWRP